MPYIANFFLWVTHFDILRRIRNDVLGLYEEVYLNYPIVQAHYGQYPISGLQKEVVNTANSSCQYDPSAGVVELRKLVDSIHKRVFKWVLIIFVIGTILGITWLRASVGIFESLTSTLITVLIGGPWFLSLLAFLILASPFVAGFSRTYMCEFNRELAFWSECKRTRDEETLVAYIIWNKSLQGVTALRVLVTFAILDAASTVPGWDPYNHILFATKRNVPDIVQKYEDGRLAVIKTIFSNYIERHT